VRPVLSEFSCAAIIVHHTGKPPKGSGQGRSWARHSDLVYSGLGSSEFGNAPRVTFALEETDEEGLFMLAINKKLMEIGWQDPDGKPTGVKWLRHSRDGTLCWREVDITEVKLKREGKRCTAEALVEEFLPRTGGLRLSELLAMLKDNGVSARLARKVVDEMVKDKELAREMRSTGPKSQPVAWITWQGEK
jgi:hypothetical protein